MATPRGERGGELLQADFRAQAMTGGALGLATNLDNASGRHTPPEYGAPAQGQDDCHAAGGRRRLRQARVQRTYSFNRMVGIDVCYVPWRGDSIPVLNVIDHGTRYQSVAVVCQDGDRQACSGKPSARDAWRTFRDMRLRPFGAPEVAFTHGARFTHDFAEGLELRSTFRHLLDANRWQNGLAQISDLDELQPLLSHMVVCKKQ